VSLTTVLAHSSGEWIASDWPVCALSEMATPRRMGAALTYARRYALFTLVGIAGEEDLDAPDLAGQPGERPGSAGNGSAPGKANGRDAPETFRSFSANRKPWSPPKPALDPEKSAVLRDQLLSELGSIASQEEATAWAKGALGAKNTLTAADSVLVEAAFAARLAEFGDGGLNEEPLPSQPGVSNDDEAIAGGTVAPATDPPAVPDFQPSTAATPAQLAESVPAELRAMNAPKMRRGRRPASEAPAPENRVASPVTNSWPEQRVNDAVAWHIDKSVLTLSEPRRSCAPGVRILAAVPCVRAPAVRCPPPAICATERAGSPGQRRVRRSPLPHPPSCPPWPGR
jgi:hypothetical protein